jgi:ArsR family transcriptional regulator
VAALSTYEELCACQITELLQVSGATASRHLSQLVNAEILESRKEGRWVYYWLDKTRSRHQPIVDWLQAAFLKSREIKDDRSALKKIITRDPEEICRKQRGDACCPKKN